MSDEKKKMSKIDVLREKEAAAKLAFQSVESLAKAAKDEADANVARFKKECFRNDPDLTKKMEAEVEVEHRRYREVVDADKRIFDKAMEEAKSVFEKQRKEEEARYQKARDSITSSYKDRQTKRREGMHTAMTSAETHAKKVEAEHAGKLKAAKVEWDKAKTALSAAIAEANKAREPKDKAEVNNGLQE